MDITKETIKAFADIDRNIDDSFQKLSDKLHDLELSHNRKKKALLQIEDIARYIGIPSILDICDKALWSDGKYNWYHKSGVQHKKTKGGRKCA